MNTFLPAVLRSLVLTSVILLGTGARAQTILGTTGAYGVMGGGVVTVVGAGTTITGNLGAGSLVGSATFGTQGSLVSPLTAQNLTDFNRAYNGLAALTPTTNLTGLNLGSTAGAITLTPGVYNFTTAAHLTGNLVLDAQGQSNAVWVFQMATTFNTTASSSVTFMNTVGDPVANYGLFWQVTGATVFGASTLFKGNLLDGSTIDLGAGVQVNNGRLLTATGTIGLATDTINFAGANSGYSGGLAFVDTGSSLTAIPELGTYALFAGAAALALGVWRRRSRAIQP